MGVLRRVVLAAAVITAGCQPHVQTTVDLNVDGPDVRARSAALVAAEGRKDIAAIMPFWAEYAVVHSEGVPAVEGHAAIRQLYGQFLPTLVALDATITDVRVAHSGDLAFETGANHFTFAQDGGQVKVDGKYLAVWEKGPDGLWRIIAISVTNDHPPATVVR